MITWPEVSLADVSERPQYGAIAKGIDKPVGPLFIRQTDITGGRVDWSSVPYCDLTSRESDKYVVRTGDLLVSRLGNGVGNAATVSDDRNAVFAGYLVRFRPLADLAVPEFVGYQLQTSAWRRHVLGFRSGAAQPTLNAQQMGEFTFLLPPIRVQHGIVATLAPLDDKIESNRRAIGIMERLGGVLFEERLSQGRGLTGNRSLGDLLAILETGSRPRGGAVVASEGVPSLGAENVKSAGIGTNGEFKRVSVEFAQSMTRGRLEDEDILVYKDGAALTSTSGASIVSAYGHGFPVSGATINEHVYRVRGAGGVSQGLLYWLLRSTLVNQEIRKRVTGAAIPGLNSTNLRSVPVPNLDYAHLGALNMQLDALLREMLRRGAENTRLAGLRDALMPELLAGRIRVPEAQEAMA